MFQILIERKQEEDGKQDFPIWSVGSAYVQTHKSFKIQEKSNKRQLYLIRHRHAGACFHIAYSESMES